MSEIPTLLEVLEKHVLNRKWTEGLGYTCSCICWHRSTFSLPDIMAGVEAEHRAHIAEAYREARTILTAEVADGWVVRSPTGTVAGRFDQTRGVVLGDDRTFPWISLQSPALVLWTPRDEASNAQ